MFYDKRSKHPSPFPATTETRHPDQTRALPHRATMASKMRSSHALAYPRFNLETLAAHQRNAIQNGGNESGISTLIIVQWKDIMKSLHRMLWALLVASLKRFHPGWA
ncbi:MAG TPA: hypothetical protein VJ577_16700 [Burkholderiaceae bacterium]|nr:hypothetical protein [Burkholderiaceae bacterium]